MCTHADMHSVTYTLTQKHVFITFWQNRIKAISLDWMSLPQQVAKHQP